MLPEQNFGKLTRDDLRQAIALLPMLEQHQAAFHALSSEDPDKFSEIFFGATWAHLYELPYPQLLLDFLQVAGLREYVAQAAKQEAPVESLLKLAEIDSREGDIGATEELEPIQLLAYLHAVQGNLNCVLLYGEYLCDLLAKARDGDMPALLRAIRVDPSVVSGPTGAKSLSAAIAIGNKGCLDDIRNAMAGRTGKQARILNKFRFLAQVLHEIGELGRPTRELVDLVLDLGIYTETKNGDPEKNLSELLRKFRKLKKPTISK